MKRAHTWLRAILDRVVAVELWVAVALFGLAGVVIAVEIVARRVFNLPFVWAEDLTVFLFVWTAFLAPPCCMTEERRCRSTR
ncbi:MAG: TRAP transporter small permease subunit [Betaproteobacteria bacterium]|nr:TRAP transporter small permease subunit [Betaproteobacteria bacterium]